MVSRVDRHAQGEGTRFLLFTSNSLIKERYSTAAKG